MIIKSVQQKYFAKDKEEEVQIVASPDIVGAFSDTRGHHRPTSRRSQEAASRLDGFMNPRGFSYPKAS